MSQGVTYADLRFVKVPRRESQEEGRGPKDGELTYENIQGPRTRGQEEEEEEETPREPEDARGESLVPSPLGGGFCTTKSSRFSSLGNVKTAEEMEGKDWSYHHGCLRESDRRTWYAILALLATCLFLLATAIGLGVRYGQLSQQLQRESQNHAAQSNLLAQRLDTLEESLSSSQELLRKAERDLRLTRKALEESWRDGNRTQRQLGDQVRQADLNLTHLKHEKEQVERALGEATSCQQMGCCPHGWKIFRWKCLWVSPSSERKSWGNSKEACQARSSQLLILKPWSARELWDGVIARDEEGAVKEE
uniref:B-cell differentiation antigen CD72-like n=1 Tax=Podarcis muralis TaxID=64176 RepID=UPI00109F8130|nr:B-cell differentiation antigen CD72-like [Podarcis muralis]